MMKTTDLINKLSQSPKPATTLLSLWFVFFMALSAGFATILMSFLISGGYPDWQWTLLAPDVFTAMVLALLLPLIATYSARPGNERWGYGGLILLALGLLIMALPLTTRIADNPAGPLFCMVDTTLLIPVPFVIIFYALKQSAPTKPLISGMLGGAATTSYAYIAVRLICPNDAPLHLLTANILPLVVYITLCGFITLRYLRW